MRLLWPGWLIVPLTFIPPFCASAAEDSDASRLVAECSAPDLPQSSIDSCLERVRVREETDPSPELQSLEATLERGEKGGATHSMLNGPAAAPNEVSVAAPAATEPEAIAPQAPDNSNARVLAGTETEDEPPVADPPDNAPTAEPSTDDQSGAPQ